MNVTHDMSVLSLITGASVLVQLVMLGLLLCSVFSWYYIFLKVFTFKRAAKQSDKFEKDFWSGGDLNELFQRASIRATRRVRWSASSNRVFANSPSCASNRAGFGAKHRGGDGWHAARDARDLSARDGRPRIAPVVPGVSRLGSPYVGLFGTVWGIMNSFRGLAQWHRQRSAPWRPASPKR